MPKTYLQRDTDVTPQQEFVTSPATIQNEDGSVSATALPTGFQVLVGAGQTVTISGADGQSILFNADGSMLITVGATNIIALAVDGTLTLNGSTTIDTDGNVSLASGVALVDIGGTVTIGDGQSIVALPGGGAVTINAALKVLGLPSADPAVDKQLYTDGVVSAGVPKALMVSGG